MPLNFNNLYSGQKSIIAVIKSVPPRAKSIKPKTPETIPVMYMAEIITAATILITLSIVPMFLFMIACFKVTLKLVKRIKSFVSFRTIFYKQFIAQ